MPHRSLYHVSKYNSPRSKRATGLPANTTRTVLYLDAVGRARALVCASSRARLGSRPKHAALIPVDPSAVILDLAVFDKVAELELRLEGALQKSAEEQASRDTLEREVREHDESVLPFLSMQACEVSEMQSRLVEMTRSGAQTELKDAALRSQTEGMLARLQSEDERLQTENRVLRQRLGSALKRTKELEELIADQPAARARGALSAPGSASKLAIRQKLHGGGASGNCGNVSGVAI